MDTIFLRREERSLDQGVLQTAFSQALSGKTLRKVLLLPPDISRMHSYAGPITCLLYRMLSQKGISVDVMPTLGTHMPMEQEEREEMYPEIPAERFLVHRWKEDVVSIGTIPGSFVSEISEGYYNSPVDVQINRCLVDGSYDLILSIGQVVPHEVVGMANYNKNIFVGCGGSTIINQSHYIGALYGMERMMGRDHSPVHRLFDYAQEHFLKNIPLLFFLTVTTVKNGHAQLEALGIGDKREVFEKAIAESQKRNLTFLKKPLKNVVVFLDEREFKTTWIGNKAIYRTRMAIADGGRLLIIAPGLKGCGEDPENDRLIRKYGYVGRDRICRLTQEKEELQQSLSVAAHIIHSSSEDRFEIIYAPGHMTKEEIESINYRYMPLEEAIRRYPPEALEDGMQSFHGEEIFVIKNPAVGLWADETRFYGITQEQMERKGE